MGYSLDTAYNFQVSVILVFNLHAALQRRSLKICLQHSSQNMILCSEWMGRYYLSSAVHIPAYIIFPSQWMKMVRNGSQFTTYSSLSTQQYCSHSIQTRSRSSQRTARFQHSNTALTVYKHAVAVHNVQLAVSEWHSSHFNSSIANRTYSQKIYSPKETWNRFRIIDWSLHADFNAAVVE